MTKLSGDGFGYLIKDSELEMHPPFNADFVSEENFTWHLWCSGITHFLRGLFSRCRFFNGKDCDTSNNIDPVGRFSDDVSILARYSIAHSLSTNNC